MILSLYSECSMFSYTSPYILRQHSLPHFKHWPLLVPENTHKRGKYHCTADLLFDWFGFNQTSKTVVHSTWAKQLNPNKITRRSVVQCHYFPLVWVFFDEGINSFSSYACWNRWTKYSSNDATYFRRNSFQLCTSREAGPSGQRDVS